MNGGPERPELRLTRRQLFLAAGTTAVVAALAACNRQPGSVSPPDAKLRAKTDPNDPRLVAFGKASQAFTAALMQQLLVRPGNQAVSPYLVAQSLAMLAQGASASTLSQTLNTMRVPLGAADLGYAVNGVTQALSALPKTKISSASALYASGNVKVRTSFKTALATNFGSSIQPADFDDLDGAIALVNGWMGDRTTGRFPEVFAPDQIPTGTRLLAVSAAYLRAMWKDEFDPASTRSVPFQVDAKQKVAVPMMMRVGQIPALSANGLDAVVLPFEDANLRLLVVAPPLDGLDAFLQTADPAALIVNPLTTVAPIQARLWLPRFQVRVATDLGKQLKAMGMKDAFDGLAADFTAMTTSEVQLGPVQHEAWLRIGERGTETAGDVGSGSPSGPPPGTIDFKIDRPFFYAVQDATSGTVLFAGVVRDPTRGAG